MTHRKLSKKRSKTPVEPLLGRRVRQTAMADFNLCEPILFKANERTKTVPATFIIRKGLSTSFLQLENSTWIMLVNNKHIARLDEDNVKTALLAEETISQSEPEPQMKDLHIKLKPLRPHQLWSMNNLNHQSLREHQQETENSRTDLENLYPKTSLKKEKGCDGFKQTSRNLDVLVLFQRTKEELS